MHWSGLLLAIAVALYVYTAEYGELVAAETKVEVVKDACPGEGCVFGNWEVYKETPIRAVPDDTSPPIEMLVPGESITAKTGEIHMVPGIAKVVGPLPEHGKGIEKNKPVEILDYIGEGYSRVRQGSNYFEVKIARSRKECPERTIRYCWVELVREPTEGKWWVFVQAKSRELRGWVDMDVVGIRRPSGRH
jgi:hypothetical protein